MNRDSAAASDADADIARAFERARCDLDSDPVAGVAMLYELESLVSSRLVCLRDDALRVADANAAAVELVGQAQADVTALESAKERLEHAKADIERRHGSLMSQAGAAADAAVEAVLMLESSNEQLMELDRVHKAVQEKTAALERAASTDALTGLFNRRYFRDQLVREVSEAARTRRALAIVFLDVDHFKQLNDRCGHDVGDDALAQVAGLIQRTVRWRDSLIRRDGMSFAARYGGEEFIVILPRTTAHGGYAAAERLRRTIAATDISGGRCLPGGGVTVSCGVASGLPGATLAHDERAMHKWSAQLIRCADEALYAAKNEGRNRVVVAAPLAS